MFIEKLIIIKLLLPNGIVDTNNDDFRCRKAVKLNIFSLSSFS